jgi:hypothetical protein
MHLVCPLVNNPMGAALPSLVTVAILAELEKHVISALPL